MQSLRCPGRKHGEIVDDGVVEVYCNSRNCGAVAGTAVLHRFDTRTGELLSTTKYKVPPKSKKGVTTDAIDQHSASVRNP